MFLKIVCRLDKNLLKQENNTKNDVQNSSIEKYIVVRDGNLFLIPFADLQKIKELEENTKNTFYKIEASEEAMRYNNFGNTHSKAESIRLFNYHASANDETTGVYYAVFLSKDGKISCIGFCSIYKLLKSNYVSFAYFLDSLYHGKGYGTRTVKMLIQQAKKQKNVEKIELCIHRDNIPSQRVAIKNGFTQYDKKVNYVKGMPAYRYVLDIKGDN